MDHRTPADSRVTLTQLMGPGSANTLGNVHGGYIMKLCDDMDDFREKFKKVFKKAQITAQMSFNWEGKEA